LRTINVSRFRKSVMVYAIILLVIADLFLVMALIPDIFNGYSIYPFILNFDRLRSQLACFMIPISIGIIISAALLWKVEHAIHPIIVVALLAANMIACCARFTGLGLATREQASIQFGTHIYNVIATEQYAGPGDARWITLYECDGNNFLCRIITHKYVLSTDATLIPDPAAHTVTLAINGEAVYVHQVK